MEQSKIKKTVLIASLAVLVLIGSTAAFLTSTDTVDNWFEVGKVDLSIEEKLACCRTDDYKATMGQKYWNCERIVFCGSLRSVHGSNISDK